MIFLSKILREYITAQESMEDFCQRTEISRQTIYNIMKDNANVSSEVVAKLLKETGMDFEKAFEVKE